MIWRDKMKKRCLIILFFILSSIFLPVISIANNCDGEFNLSAEIEPFRKVFPKMYTLLVKAQFDYSYHCTNGSYPGGDTLTFQVIRLADDELIYNETKEMKPLDSHSGYGGIIDYRCTSGIRRFISFYEAKIIFNIEDHDPSDNEVSCIFLVVEMI